MTVKAVVATMTLFSVMVVILVHYCRQCFAVGGEWVVIAIVNMAFGMTVPLKRKGK